MNGFDWQVLTGAGRPKARFTEFEDAHAFAQLASQGRYDHVTLWHVPSATMVRTYTRGGYVEHRTIVRTAA